MTKWRWIVSQFGAREHYAVPRALARGGELRCLYTDTWCRRGHALLRRGPGPVRAFAQRFHPELKETNVVSFNAAEIWRQIQRKLRKHPDTKRERYLEFLEMAELLDKRVMRHLQTQDLAPGNDLFFGFTSGCLETFRLLRERNIFSILDQIDPGKLEDDLVRAEAERWPGWQVIDEVPESYYERVHEEWELADRILVNSEWSRQALIAQGVPREKLCVVPLAYEPEGLNAAGMQRSTSGRLTVLWLGLVDLRKGIPYFLDAARRLENAPIDFVVAGPIAISQDKVTTAPSNVCFLGRVTRDRVAELYRQADLYVLPTISDGFAITQLEAMAHGVPVVATPHCGEVVTPGVDGWIIPARDADALAGVIHEAQRNREKLTEMSRSALTKSRQFTLERYRQQLQRILPEANTGT